MSEKEEGVTYISEQMQGRPDTSVSDLQASLQRVLRERDAARAALAAATANEIRMLGENETLHRELDKLKDWADNVRPIVNAAVAMLTKRDKAHGSPDVAAWWQGHDWNLVVTTRLYMDKLKEQNA